MRIRSLNGKWKCKPDINDIGIKSEWFKPDSYDKNDTELLDIEIPNSFNTLKGYEIYEGIFWHFFKFGVNETLLSETSIFRLKFKGSNYNTKVWLNGKYLGENNGGFVPFHFNFEKIKQKSNFLVVRTENLRKKDRVPAISFDWLNWGGIYRDINLLFLNENRIKDIVITTKLISKEKSRIDISYKIIGKLSIYWQILDSTQNKVLFKGKLSIHSGSGSFNFIFENPELWDPENPYLYYLKIFDKNTNEKIYETSFGIREIEVKGRYIYLNKNKILLKGASLHEELMPFGRTIPYKERERDIKSMKSLGFNALRTAHYSHDEMLIEIADKEGILILEEIPVYWACNFKSQETFRTAAKMMRSLIKRDINHPSVIWWSVGNEIPIERPEVSKFIKRLMNWVRLYDNTRIVTYVSMKLFTDLTRRYADVATINFYFGWYIGSTRLISLMLDVMRTPTFNKPWIYTEFGAGAKYGFHDSWNNQTKFSEEKQLHVIDYSIRTFNAKDYIAGWFIWIYRDFRSFLRQNEFQEGYNRKGIVSEKNEKKLISYRIPQILNKKRNLMNTKVLGIFLWIILYIPAYILTYLLLDAGIIFGDKKTIEKKKKIDKERILREYEENH